MLLTYRENATDQIAVWKAKQEKTRRKEQDECVGRVNGLEEGGS